MSATINLWELLTTCQTIITFITNSSDELPWQLHTDFIKLPMASVDKHIVIQQKIQGKPLHEICILSFTYSSNSETMLSYTSDILHDMSG